jgi:hypothetical protein
LIRVTRSPPPMIRRALPVADRIDAVASAVGDFQRAMMMDVDLAAMAMRDEEMLAEINQPTYRGMRVDGVRVQTGSSRNCWRGS